MDGTINRLSPDTFSWRMQRIRWKRPPERRDVIRIDPLVSVILPTYNGARRGYLPEAIESVLAQTYPRWELIIVNDGSTDVTPVLLGRYAQPGVRVIHQLNQGLAAARNTGIRYANGEYICFLDDDDRWLPEKLERQVRFFRDCERRTRGRVKLVFTPITLIDARGRVIGQQAHTARGDVYHALFTTNLIDSPSSVMLKRDVLDTVGSFDPSLHSIEDLDLWLRIAHDHEIHSMSEPLVEYRVHADKMSTHLDAMYTYRRLVIERALDANRRTNVRLNRGAVLFNIEKQYFNRCLQAGDAEGAARHLQRAWFCSRWRLLCHPKMPVKLLCAQLGLGRRFVCAPAAESAVQEDRR